MSSWRDGHASAPPSLRDVLRLRLRLKNFRYYRQRKDKKNNRSKIDLPCYKDYTEEVWITTCVIDTVRATTYLGRAIVFAQRAANCPDHEHFGCKAPIGNAITSLLWVGAFLSNAAETCGETLTSYSTACAQSILRDMATGGSVIFGIEQECLGNLSLPYLAHEDFRQAAPQSAHTRALAVQRLLRDAAARRQKEQASAAQRGEGNASKRRPSMDAHASSSFYKVLREAEVPQPPIVKYDKRSWDIAQCTFDVTNAVTWIIRAALKMHAAEACCPDPHRCPLDIAYIFASFAYVAQFISFATADCPYPGLLTGLCAQDLADIIGSLIMTGISAVGSIDYCGKAIESADKRLNGR